MVLLLPSILVTTVNLDNILIAGNKLNDRFFRFINVLVSELLVA